MANPKLAKFGAKTGLGLVVSCLIGIMIKLEHEADDRIDAHYDAKSKKPTDSDPE